MKTVELQMSTRLNKFQAVGIIVVKLDNGERGQSPDHLGVFIADIFPSMRQMRFKANAVARFENIDLINNRHLQTPGQHIDQFIAGMVHVLLATLAALGNSTVKGHELWVAQA